MKKALIACTLIICMYILSIFAISSVVESRIEGADSSNSSIIAKAETEKEQNIDGSLTDTISQKAEYINSSDQIAKQ